MKVTRTIAKINGVSIQIIDNGEKRVPIKPICEALGIAWQPQSKKINEDDFLSSVVTLSMTTGSDGKEYEMTTLPFKYIFGWLFTINPTNVKPEAQEAVKKYKMECYDVLYNHFTAQSKFMDEKTEILNIELDKLNKIRQDFNATRDLLKEQNKIVDKVRHQTFEEWKANNMQIAIPFVD
jgi:hypothetical protein